MPKMWALRCSEIWPNDDKRILAIVVDVDAEPSSGKDPVTRELISIPAAPTAWLDAGVPAPNIVVYNPASGHAHYIYLLDDPIFLGADTARAVRYAKAIQRALTKAIEGGGATYAWPNASMHNPWSERYVTTEVARCSYRLDDLAQYLELTSDFQERFEDDDIVGSCMGVRNDNLFHWLMRRSQWIIRQANDEADYEAGMLDVAQAVNASFDPPMDVKEVIRIVESVLRYRPFYRRDRAGELRAQRHAEGRSLEARLAKTRHNEREAHRLYALGLTQREIAAELGVVERTVARYLKAEIQNLIVVIPPQDNTHTNAPTETSKKLERPSKPCEITDAERQQLLLQRALKIHNRIFPDERVERVSAFLKAHGLFGTDPGDTSYHPTADEWAKAVTIVEVKVRRHLRRDAA